MVSFEEIQKEDILEIKRSYLETKTQPARNEKVEIVDDKKTRTYVYNDGDWVFVNEIDIQGIDNEKKRVPAQKKSKKKKGLVDDLTAVITLINEMKTDKAIEVVNTIIHDRVPFLKEIEFKEKKKRAKTFYNSFISAELIKIKEEQPSITPPQRMRLAVERYHQQNNKQ